MIDSSRRTVLISGLGAAAAAFTRDGFAAPPGIPIIDSHIHLFDPNRPDGIPWPDKSETVLYQPALPARYKAVTEGLGIVGAIAIEASSRKADNDWLLQTAQANPVVVGIVGDLVPDDRSFAEDLQRLHRSPLFLGIRYGNLWQRNLAVDLDRPGFINGLKLLAERGLILESANPDPPLLAAVACVSDKVPDLTLVLDHLPHMAQPIAPADRASVQASLRILSASPRVFLKFSEIPQKISGVVSADLAPYREHLDQIWSQFGASRLIYGSDWPNSDTQLSFRKTFKLVEDYLQQKSFSAREQVYWRNSARAYRWKPRSPKQPAI